MEMEMGNLFYGRQLRAPVKHLNDGSRRGATTLVYNFYRKQSQTLKQKQKPHKSHLPLALCLISMVFMLP